MAPKTQPRRAPRTAFLVELAYDGRAFHGVQLQPGFSTVGSRLVERLEAAFGGAPNGLSFAARTDAGVSATQNFASFWYRGIDDEDAPLERLSTATGSAEALRIVRAVRLPKPLRARNAARSKRYAYHIIEDPADAVPSAVPAWHTTNELDLLAMQRAARVLIGRHDFAAFRSTGCSAKTSVRSLFCLDVRRDAAGICIRVEGDGFLRRMVRIIAGTLFEVGSGTRSASDVQRVLSSRERSQAGITAPARGLVLERVEMDVIASVARGLPLAHETAK